MAAFASNTRMNPCLHLGAAALAATSVIALASSIEARAALDPGRGVTRTVRHAKVVQIDGCRVGVHGAGEAERAAAGCSTATLRTTAR